MVPLPHTDLRTFRRLFAQARRYLPHLAGILVLGLFGPALALLYPLPIKIAVDSVLGSHPLPAFLAAVVPPAFTRTDGDMLLTAACLLLAITLVGQLQRTASAFLCDYTGQRLVLNLRAQVFGHVQRLSLSYHESKGTADAAYRLLRDATSIQDILINGAIPLVNAGVMFIALVYITARLDAALALVAVAMTPFLLFFSWLYRGRLRSQWRELKSVESSVMSITQEVLGMLRVIKAFGREDKEQERFVRRSSEGLQVRMRLSFLRRQLAFLIGLTIACGQAAVLVIGIRHVRADMLTLGELLMVMAYMRRLYDPLKTATQKLTDLQASLASAERVFALLDEQPDVPERPDARPLANAEGHVSFRDVSFSYARGQPVLQHVSMDIPPGTRVGVLGTSGAGKTTLVNLLGRFHDPSSGAILLDGVDLRDYRLADLRNQFAVVPQEPVLFAASIAENIAYARPDASRQDVIAAATAANAHDFIANLPKGYETAVGERGMSLSGGERQRIALARAFLRDAPILILDEPTSSVDVASETAIMDAITRLTRTRTTFMIAHRPNAPGIFDMIVRMEEGQVVNVTTEPAGADLISIS